MLNSSDLLSDLGQFITDLFQDMASGLLFFGGPLDITIAILDVLATALVVYYVLKILRDSRAWQLLKGIILIVGFALLCSLAGLNTVGFLLNNTISVLAIAFVVIFQPELRRALETVGRNSFNVLSSAISPEETAQTVSSVHHLIEAIVRACEKMSESRTGALIIIERNTKLGELAEQENVVQLDAAVSSTFLQQIFYKGSPLHDGAVLIRDGRVGAARVHVPLSDNYHLRRDYGTRHRAAIGASEIGDTIAVVVSEERGTISLSLEGRLYTLDNGDALRALLHKLLSTARSTGLTGLFRGNRRVGAAQRVESQDQGRSGNRSESARKSGDKPVSGQSGYDESRPTLLRRIFRTGNNPAAPKVSRKQRVLLTLASIAIAIILWLYVQVTINPIDTRSFTVTLGYRGVETALTNGFKIQYPIQSVQISVQGRRNTLNDLRSADIEAYVDFSDIDEVGLNTVEVAIDTGTLLYTRSTYISPSSITVSVREAN